MEREILYSQPFRVCIVAPYSRKKIVEEMETLLQERTASIIFRGVELVRDSTLADCAIVIDDKPKEVARLAEHGRVVLVTVKNRKPQSLNTYIFECKHFSGSNWKNVRVVNINSNYEGEVVQKWWDLHVTLLGISEASL
jgi:hypothetical protein